MLIFFSIFWFIRQIKSSLFWLYLWQLKEYHIGRFIDHFRTDKGKRLLINKILFFKIFLSLIFLLYFKLPTDIFSEKTYIYFFNFIFILPFFGLILYFFESIYAIFNIFQKKIKIPVLTKKTATLILAFLFFNFFSIGFAFFVAKEEINKINPILFVFPLLIFDILTPVIVSGIVLILQPLAVAGRNEIIRRAKNKREKFKKLIVVGITGSFGKTSTKEFLATILEWKFGKEKVLKTKEHQNSEIGISQCILNELNEKHEIFIVEMGAYNRGGIKLLCDIVKPKHGILTGINEQHMATQGSLENIIKTKYELVESLPGMGFVVFNGDNEYCRLLYKKTNISKRICYTKFFAASHEVVAGDYWTRKVKVEKEAISFKVFSKWGEIVQFRVNVLGEHLAQNILMAAIISKEIMGMSLEEIAKACQNIKPEQGGMKLIRGINNLNILDATYSANPDSVISHLEYLKVWSGKKIIVMPCLIELGKASKEVHKRIGRKIGLTCDLAIITTKERFQEIGEGAVENGMKKENILFTENPVEIFKILKTFSQPEDIILLESRIPIDLMKLLKV